MLACFHHSKLAIPSSLLFNFPKPTYQVTTKQSACADSVSLISRVLAGPSWQCFGTIIAICYLTRMLCIEKGFGGKERHLARFEAAVNSNENVTP